jgi:hypothetical protein
MQHRRSKPVDPGWGDPAPQNRGGTPKNEERRQAGTPATLEGDIDNAIDEKQNTVNRTVAQGHAIRWLVSHYPISANVAAIIANELGMGGAR